MTKGAVGCGCLGLLVSGCGILTSVAAAVDQEDPTAGLLGTLFFSALLLTSVVFIAGLGYLKQRKRLQRQEETIRALRSDRERIAREEWFDSLAHASYRNEIEVEVKFIYPLVQFLGYEDSDVQLRPPVDLQVGREAKRKEADWVLWKSLDGVPQACVVIEAKKPSEVLEGAVQAQARSYAFGLDAITYVVTNGHELKIFQRKVQNDVCVVDCTVDELAEAWPDISRTMGCRMT